MLELFMILLIFVILLVFVLLFVLYWKKRKREQFKKKDMKMKLKDIGTDLMKQIKEFLDKPTKINFIIRALTSENYFDTIIWDNKEYSLKKVKELNFSLSSLNFDDSIITQKSITLIKENIKKEFMIEIYLHQNNYYDLFIDFNEDSYSMEAIFFSFTPKLFPESVKINNVDLTRTNFGLKDRIVVNSINIRKECCIEFINKYDDSKIIEDDPIFNIGKNNIFINVFIKHKKERKKKRNITTQKQDKIENKLCLFLKEKEKLVYELKKSEIDLLNKFYNLIIIPFVFPLKSNKLMVISDLTQDKFKEEISKFIQDNDKNISKINDTSNNLIQLKENEENISNNSIPSDIDVMTSKELIKDNDSNDSNSIESKEEDNSSDSVVPQKLNELHNLLYNFFDVPLNKRYINEPTQQEIQTIEKICYLDLSINTSFDLKKIIQFSKVKERVLKQNLNCSNKEKIKIIISLSNHILENDDIYDNIELMRMEDLPEYSPYVEGELMFRNIIKCMDENSLIGFIFLQLNSGGDYDFLSKNDCYKIKMIPLDIIKYHLLKNHNECFFRYWNKNSTKAASTDSYSLLESFNERICFGENKWKGKNIASKKNLDNSIKFCLLQFHEKGHEKYNGDEKMENSPRFIISHDLNLYDNFDPNSASGESGNAVEYFLFGNNEFLELLLKCKNLQALSNIKLFIQKTNKPLIKTVKDILKDNKVIRKKKIKLYNHLTTKNTNKNSDKNLDGYTFSKMTYHQKGIYKHY